MDRPGVLFVVPTPIGNLQDITFRAVEVLGSVDVILAEDTRTTGVLLKHYHIDTSMQSYHIHNEHRTVDRCVGMLMDGKNLALVSDAGTPAISDPGYLIVREALKHSIRVECLPGANAAIPALVQSGIPTDRFVFEGFIPHKKGRKKRLLQIATEHRTCILYESPHRLLKTLQQLLEMSGNRQVAVVRELTKMYEETVRGTLKQAIDHFSQHPPKGEFVIVLEGSSNRSPEKKIEEYAG